MRPKAGVTAAGDASVVGAPSEHITAQAPPGGSGPQPHRAVITAFVY